MTTVSSASRTSVAVVGLGAIGGVAAACLEEAGRHAVIACARRPMAGLTLERPGRTVALPLRILADPAEAAPVDWVLLCTKAHETPSAARWLSRLCCPTTRVAVLQNGIDHAQRVGPLVGGATVLPVIVYYNGERLAPDRVRLTPVAESDVTVPDTSDGHAFAALLEGSALTAAVRSDFDVLLWRKLLLNVVANPITALVDEGLGVLHQPDLKALGRTLLDEAVAVARADGVALPDDEADRAHARLLGFPATAGTSMYFDHRAGRPLEIEALNGAVVAIGERLGVPTPVNQAMLALLRAVNDRRARAEPTPA